MKPPKSTREDVFLQYKLWLSNIAGEGIIDEKIIKLLKEIANKGSLSLAAKSLGQSYRKAWGDIKNAEVLLGYQLTEKKRGGKSGGCSTLTEKSLKLIEAYDALKKIVDENMIDAGKQFKKKIDDV